MATTSVWYYVLGKKNKILWDKPRHACYSSITYGALPQNAVAILCYHHKSDTPYTTEQCREWIKHVRSWGFPMQYIGMGHKGLKISKDHHVYRIPILQKGRKIYSSKTWLTSALMMVRYTMESGINSLPEHFFRLLPQLPKTVDTFRLMQYCHRFIHGNSNHSVREFHTQTLITKEEFTQRANKRQYSIYNSNFPSITSLWEGTRVNFTAEQLKDHVTIFNRLINNDLMIKAYVVGGDTDYINWLPNTKACNTLEEADLVVFTGGEDVDPSLYNEPCNKYTSSNIERDLYEQQIFKKAKERNLKMLGVCRGSQFLCVMAGGRLVQHQYNPGTHEMTLLNGTVRISSTHHQAAYPFDLPPGTYNVLGYTQGISPIHLDGEGKELNPPKECEVVHYRNVNALGIQGHPEFDSYQRDPQNNYSLNVLKSLYNRFINDQI